MMTRPNNFAFIDSQNVNLNTRSQGWQLDWIRFRRYLLTSTLPKGVSIHRVRWGMSRCTRFSSEPDLFAYSAQLERPDGTIKGNVDAELVLHTMIELDHFDRRSS